MSLKVEKGSITCLLGPNGAGKSTTLNTIMGLLKPWSGVVEFNGFNVACKDPHEIAKLGVSLVPEGRGVFRDMSVYENLQMGAYLKQTRRRFRDSLERVYSLFPVLKKRKNQKAASLSGGEQSMLVIARALVSNPKMLMLDEPSLGLAPKIAQELLNVTKSLQRDEGLTILLVEQSICLACKVMDKGYVISNGVTVAEGIFEELIDNPHS